MTETEKGSERPSFAEDLAVAVLIPLLDLAVVLLALYTPLWVFGPKGPLPLPVDVVYTLFLLMVVFLVVAAGRSVYVLYRRRWRVAGTVQVLVLLGVPLLLALTR
ncbi:hypothetical protein [Streptomyces paludis]|nr:hypothetical protein [Streptomyces paludis]